MRTEEGGAGACMIAVEIFVLSERGSVGSC